MNANLAREEWLYVRGTLVSMVLISLLTAVVVLLKRRQNMAKNKAMTIAGLALTSLPTTTVLPPHTFFSKKIGSVLCDSCVQKDKKEKGRKTS